MDNVISFCNHSGFWASKRLSDWRLMPKLQILLVDDHKPVRAAIRSLLGVRSDWIVCGEAADGLDAVEKVRWLRPDVVLMDISMPRMDGVEATRIIRREWPETNVIIISQNDPALVSRQAAGLGAHGFVAKADLSRELIPAIDKIGVGEKSRVTMTSIPEEPAMERSDSASEKQFRHALDALPAAVYITDAEGRLTYFNAAAINFSGRIPEIGSDSWCVSWKLFRPDGTPLPHDQSAMAVTLKEGRAVYGEEAIAERPDGTRRWFEPFPTPLRDAEGKIVGGINMLIDITERKRHEQTSSLLAAIVGSSDDAIVSKNLNGIITSWNQSAERIFGYSAAEAIGKHITLIIPPDRQEEEVEILARLRRGERTDHFDTVRRRKDGSLVDVSLTISPVRDDTGTIVGASKVARHITERKRAERTVGLLASIVDFSDDAIVSKTLEGTITSWNRSAERLFGYSAAEAIGQHITLIIPSDRLEEEKEIIAKLKRGEKVDHFDTVRRRKDGSLLNLSLTISPVRDGSGRIIGASKVARDISERMRSEHALAHAAREQRALFHLADGLHRAQALEEVYECAMSAICEAVECDRTAILLADAQGIMRFVAWHGLSDHYRKEVEGHSPWKAEDRNPQIVSLGSVEAGTVGADLEKIVRAEGIGALAFIPLVSQNKLVGKFMTYYPTAHFFTSKELDLCTTIARQLSFAIERKKAEQELRSSEERFRVLSKSLDAQVRTRTKELEQRNTELLRQSGYVRNLSRRLLKAQDEERRHIARELHDSAGQTLTVLGMNFVQLIEKARMLDPKLAELAQASEQMVQQLHQEIRTTSYLLHPPLLDENGLASALAWYTQGLSGRGSASIHLEIGEDFGRIPTEMELVVFRLVQECLTNIHRHANAKNATIRLWRQVDRVSVEIEDDGRGMSAQKLAEVQSVGSGVGIRGMRERVRQLQGEMEIGSDPSGTKVRANIPIPDSATEAKADSPQETAA